MEKIDPQTRLEGRTVILVPLLENHFPRLAAAASNPAIFQFMLADMSSPQKCLEKFNEALAERERGTQLPFVILERSSGAIIGSTRLMNIEPEHNKLEIGWTWLRPEYWAREINFECKLLLLDHCFNQLKVKRVFLKTDKHNLRSRRAILKIGAKYEGILRADTVRPDGTYRNSVYFSILDYEWPEKKTRLVKLFKQKLAGRFVFRNGTPGDLEQLRVLGLSSYGQFRQTLSEDAWKKMEAGVGNPETYAGLLNTGKCFVCEHEGRITGMAFLVPSGNPFAFFKSEWSYIRLVGVDPAYEGCGIGRRLTELCVESAANKGEQVIALHTSEFQNAARHIYESMGFAVLKELEPIFEKRYWLYTKALPVPSGNIMYRRATIRDLDALVEMRIRFTTLLTGIDTPERITEIREYSHAYFSEVLENDSGIWVIAISEGKAVGAGGLLIRKNPPNFKNPSGDMGYVVNIYTVPELRRKGVCRKVMTLLEEEALKQGIRVFELHATKDGQRVYPGQGFELHDEPTYRKYIR